MARDGAARRLRRRTALLVQLPPGWLVFVPKGRIIQTPMETKMNKFSALALGAALALSLPLAASAQDAGAAPEVDAGAGVDANAGATTSDYSYADLDAALQGAANANLSSVTADTTIDIVAISTLGDEGQFTKDAFATSRSEYADQIATLQSNVGGNADITSALEAGGYSPDDVVGVWSQADGTLTVFVDDSGSASGSDAGAGADANGGADADGGAEAPAQ